MARPINADPESTRQRILDAASHLFAERGLDGTSVRDVAREAGVSVGIVHHYFGSKDALHDRCLHLIYGQLNAALQPLADMFERTVADLSGAHARGELDQLIADVVSKAFRFAREQQPVVRMVMRTVVETGEMEPMWRAEAHLPFLRRTAAALAPIVGKSERELRLAVQTMTALVMRYGLATGRELVLMTGEGNDGVNSTSSRLERAALASVEAHLIDTARALLGPRNAVELAGALREEGA